MLIFADAGVSVFEFEWYFFFFIKTYVEYQLNLTPLGILDPLNIVHSCLTQLG